MNMAMVSVVLMMLSAPTPGLVLVENGQPRCSIVVPDDARPTVRHAAEELAGYMGRMSGATVPIVAESTAGSGWRIDVGLTNKARAELPDGLVGDEERVLIRSDSSGVLVCGGGDRGTLFSVYRFLELLGCRWLTPEPENEVVPNRPTLKLDPVQIDTRPAFQWRLFNGRGSEQQERWGVKMGMNGLYSAEAAQHNGGCFYYPDQVAGVHAYEKIMPNERYFRDHPEWYPLRGAKRVATAMHGSQLCVTAPGLADEFAANVIRIFDADPSCQLMSISPNDGRGWCECPACNGLDEKLCGGRTTKQGLAGERPFRGDRVFWFANEVGRRVAEKYPDKKLLVLAYINYAEPPDTIRPLPNVVPFLCHYAPADYARAISDPESEPNRQFNELLVAWVQITPEVLIYSYVSKSMWWQLPRPVLRPFAADIKYYHQLGIRRYYCQSSLDDWALDGPLYYVISRLLWDPSADPGAIAGEWIGGMFGPAAEEMARFYEAVDMAVRKTGRPYSDNPPRDVPGLYDKSSLDEALAALARAEKVADDERVQHRVGEVAKTFRYGYWMIEALQQQRRFEELADPEALEAAIAARDKALSYRNVATAAERTASCQLTMEPGVLATGFGDAEMKGGRRCWNSDETGPGDKSHGWASFIITPSDLTKPVVLEMDVWGESALRSIVINTQNGVWNRVEPRQRLSGKPQWETLVYSIPPELLNRDRVGQKVGFGGSDSQVWIANIRVGQQ